MNSTRLTTELTDKCNLKMYYLFGFIFTTACFAWLDQFSISLGDDFGYMFTDSRLHCGDGHRVSTILDCVNTQLSHYHTTNGRFIVHLMTQIYLNILPSWIFKICDSIMFGMLWLFMIKIIKPLTTKNAISIMSTTLLLLFIATPRTGMIMLSLTAFSINYLWSGSLNFIFLYIYINSQHTRNNSLIYRIFIFGFALIIGSMHESYSLPIAGALTLNILLNREYIQFNKIILYIGYLIGTAICVFAPGNLEHTAQTGGINIINIGHKILITLEDLPSTPIPYLLLLLITSFIFKREKTKGFIHDNILLLSAVIISLLLCFLTYTSFRQLFAPSLFSIVIFIIWLNQYTDILNKFYLSITSVCILVILNITYFAGELRQQVYDNYNSFINVFCKTLSNKNNSNDFVIVDVFNSPYHTSPVLWQLFGRYAPDPWERSAFTLPFDSYSKKGLNRLYGDSFNKNGINTLLPFYNQYIINTTSSIELKRIKNSYNTISLDNRYNAICIPDSLIHSSTPNIYVINRFGKSATTPYEKFHVGDNNYFIFPHTIKQISLNGNN